MLPVNIKSYQHSFPEELHVGSGSADDPRQDGWIESGPTPRKLKVITMMVLGILFVAALTGLGSDTSSTPALLGSALEEPVTDMATLGSSKSDKDAGPPKPKERDWEKIRAKGKYDWQKCENSNDPDCWKNEGNRVHTYWQNFGAKMKTYWTNFGQRMNSYWAGLFAKKDDTPPPPPDVPAPVAPGDAPATDVSAAPGV